MTALWIKICGMTTPEAVAAALAERVDAIGFVFAESPRKVSPERAVQLGAAARGRVRCVAVTRYPTQQTIDEIIDVFQPDMLQTDIDDLPALKLPWQLEILPVLRAAIPPSHIPAEISQQVGWAESSKPNFPGEEKNVGFRRLSPTYGLPPRLLYEGQVSGSGSTCDWTSAREMARRTQLVLAGGLNADNIAAAIAAVEPFGIDVSSGVEDRPGIKSSSRIAQFVQAARATQQERSP